MKNQSKKVVKKATIKKSKKSKFNPNFELSIINKQVSKEGDCELKFDIKGNKNSLDVYSCIAQAMQRGEELREFIGTTYALYIGLEVAERELASKIAKRVGDRINAIEKKNAVVKVVKAKKPRK